MFNHYFFDGKAALEVCKAFLQEEEGEGVIMVTDPPFGGLVEPLAITFKKLIALWKEGQSQDDSHKELPIFWIFPYFFESRICQCFPSFRMLDYQVDYDNHTLYKHGKTGRKQSPVRIFTNIPPNKITLPAEEGYRFCSLCQRYVSLENQHCVHCNSCTSKFTQKELMELNFSKQHKSFSKEKDGRKWSHCFLCRKCVKPSWVHCSTCRRCALPEHSCAGPRDGCFICGALDHKRSSCPNIGTLKRAKNATVDLNPAAFKDVYLPELRNRQVAFVGFEPLQQPLQTWELSTLSRFPVSFGETQAHVYPRVFFFYVCVRMFAGEVLWSWASHPHPSPPLRSILSCVTQMAVMMGGTQLRRDLEIAEFISLFPFWGGTLPDFILSTTPCYAVQPGLKTTKRYQRRSRVWIGSFDQSINLWQSLSPENF
ncbi:hypothetical protein U0070_002690 [Myodes glareolus]|uniref:Zinc finger CCHC domain-containing protein 4 n=1 Tax=Myodes glareolus TaxID=447135 RepID=A0AAW0HP84_MYOGA